MIADIQRSKKSLLIEPFELKRIQTCHDMTRNYLKKYETKKKDAEDSAEVAEERFGQRMVHFECNWCGIWHIGFKTTRFQDER